MPSRFPPPADDRRARRRATRAASGRRIPAALLLPILVILVALPACRAQAPGDSAATPLQEPTVTSRIDIERHFSGPELELARAAAAADAQAVARLVAAGADPNAVSPGGLPLLAWPVLEGGVDGVRALLDHGADPNRAVPGTGTAMGWAVRAEDPAILGAFLDHGGDPDARTADDEPVTRLAALAGHWEHVQRLIAHGADIEASAGGRGDTTLLAYYSAGQFDKAHWLLERGADPSFQLDDAPVPSRIGARPIVENVYWWPVQAGRFPELAHWQQRCQALLAERGFTAPPEPPHLERLRLSQQAGAGETATPPRDLETEIAEREAALRERLQQR